MKGFKYTEIPVKHLEAKEKLLLEGWEFFSYSYANYLDERKRPCKNMNFKKEIDISTETLWVKSKSDTSKETEEEFFKDNSNFLFQMIKLNIQKKYKIGESSYGRYFSINITNNYNDKNYLIEINCYGEISINRIKSIISRNGRKTVLDKIISKNLTHDQLLKLMKSVE